MDYVNAFGAALYDMAFGLESRFAILYMSSTVLIAYAVWRLRGETRAFLDWLLPREVYRHPSNLVDIKLILFTVVLSVTGFFAAVAMTPVVTVHVLDWLRAISGNATPPGPATLGQSIAATIVMILTLDFCKYWAHYLHHENGVLWPFHAVHHSAEVMTPLTVSRIHPMFRVIQFLISSVVVGTVQALMLFLFVGSIDVVTIGSVNVGYVLFNLLGANLRHSHIWLSYGRVLEHVLISPAQHHIHHSADVKHHNKNYGEVFAFWDWMFGTLYVPDGPEVLTFGLADAQGNRIEQPHPTLRAALVQPFIESGQALRKRLKAAHGKPQQDDTAGMSDARQITGR